MNKELMFSSKDQTWETPLEIFNPLHKEFKFNLDPCATEKTAKCKKFFTEKDDGLKQSWKGKRVFVNPPYGRALKNWVKKCYEESKQDKTIVVMLIPSRTDTKYFHEIILPHAKEIRFLKGRIKFLINGVQKDAAPFGSMIVIFDNSGIINPINK